MRSLPAKSLVLSAILACAGVEAADLPPPQRTAPAAMPAGVLQKTREQVHAYLGNADAKGVPLLDPATDWNAQSNWPHHFRYQGQPYQLAITDLSGDSPRTLYNKAQVRPHMTAMFGYDPVSLGPGRTFTNGIFPRASWSTNGLIPGKLLIWGNKSPGGPWLTVFSYEFYPDGALYEFHWQSRDSGAGSWELFDRNGKLVGVKTANDCRWNGTQVAPDRFSALAWNLKASGGSTAAPPRQPPAAPPRR